MSTYDYRPLDPAKQEIRLLDILPFSKRLEDLVTCTLRAVSLDANPEYETISYCWGDLDRCCSILLDGKVLMIPRSTDLALRRVSSQEHTRTVWIDAVCVNQTDNQERTQQVILMAQIYSSGTNGIIYLGEGDHNSARALANLEELALDAINIAKTPFDLSILIAFKTPPVESDLRVGLEVDALAKFFALPWFRRIWIIQEAVLPAHSECVFGDSKINLDSVLIATAWLMYHFIYLPKELRDAEALPAALSLWARMNTRDMTRSTLYDGRKTLSSEEKLGYLLATQKGNVTSVEHDRVFGMLGLTKPECRLSDLIRPDYTKTLAEVMRDATRYIINIEKDFGDIVVPLIMHGCQGDASEPGWPSWVPRFQPVDTRKDPSPLPDYSLPRCSEPQISCGPNILWIKGHEIGVVDRTSDALFESGFEYRDLAQALISIGSVAALTEASNITLRLTLLAGVDWFGERCSEASYADYDAFLAFCVGTGDLGVKPIRAGDLDATSQDIGSRISRYLNGMIKICRQRKLIKTAGGHYAVVPKVCMPGDVIVMAPGCDTPIVLRQARDTDGGRLIARHFLLGECYLDGHMWPEDVERVVNSGRPLSDWYIQ